MIENVVEVRVQKKFDQARMAIDAGALDEARKRSEEGLRILEKEADRVAPNLLAEGLSILGMVHTEKRAWRDAEKCYRRVRKTKHDNPEAFYSEACYRLARWELDRAEKLLAKCREADGLQASSLDLLALLARYRGEKTAAEGLYREAACHDPDRCPMPISMTDEEARALVERLLGALPDTVREAIGNVDIQVVELPDPKLDAFDETDPEILGLYHGVPIPERSVFDPQAHPDRIRVFKHNLERIAWDQDNMIEELRTTLLHEVGHHLGWDEDDLAERGLA